MFETEKVLNSLKAKGVKFHVVNDRLICDAPKGLINKRVAQEIKENKKIIIEYLSQSQDLRETADQINRIEDKTSVPQTLSLQRLMFMEHLVSGKSSFNLPVAIKLTGDVNSAILERCLQKIVDRQEILRSTFQFEKGEPLQKIHKNLTVKLEIIDLTAEIHVSKKDYTSLMIEAGKKPFDLSVPPLFKFMLIRVKEYESIFFFVKPTIIWDGWSFDIFLNELDTLYSALIAGKSNPLPQLPIQYSDYAIWHGIRVQDDEIFKQIEYWRSKLPKKINYLQLPYDHHRQLDFNYWGNRKSFSIPNDKVNQIVKICNEENATLFIGFLTIFKILISRYTLQNDIIIGLPMWNRVRPEFENVIGHFVNIVLFHTNIQPDQNFRQLLNNVKINFFEAFNNQEAPFEKVVEDLKLTQEVSGAPLYQLYFSYQDARNRQQKIGDLQAEQVYVHSSAAATDLSFWLKESEQAIDGAIDYSSELFEPETIDKLLCHFFGLMDSVIKCPDAQINSLSILSNEEKENLLKKTHSDKYYHLDLTLLPEDERCQLLFQSDFNVKDYPKDKTIVTLFEEQVERTPERTALIYGEKSLSYRELNCKVNQVAHYLREKGVQQNSIVGVCMDRSIDLGVALLGILKAGGAYMPINPNLPTNRVDFMLEDSNCRIIVTHKRFKGTIGKFSKELIYIDSDRDRISKEKDSNLNKTSGPDNLVYVIFTSDPSGRPKGIQIHYRALVSFLFAMRKEPGLTETDTLISLADMSLDKFGIEMFLPLVVGSRVVIAEQDDLIDGRRMDTLIKKSHASMMQATPSTWRRLIESGWQGHDSLKVICGGEALTSDLVDLLLDRCRDLWNLYGTAETTIWSTAYQVKSKKEPVLIGFPMAHAKIYILDKSLKPLPPGAIGEIYIGGEGISSGYLNRPELNAFKFIPHPYTRDDRARIYRTGDFARYQKDGKIEYLGRNDHQVKNLGLRVELGEIETVIQEHPAVHQAVVNAVNNGIADARLVAYIIFKPEEYLTVSEIRRFLRQHLPEYMVPRLIVEMDILPVAANGNVDREALPNPMDEGRPGPEFVPPETPLENFVAGIWQDLLKVERVSRHDNFYELGGHSLLSMRVVAAIERETGHRLDPRLMFFKTLEEVSASVKHGLEAGS